MTFILPTKRTHLIVVFMIELVAYPLVGRQTPFSPRWLCNGWCERVVGERKWSGCAQKTQRNNYPVVKNGEDGNIFRPDVVSSFGFGGFIHSLVVYGRQLGSTLSGSVEESKRVKL